MSKSARFVKGPLNLGAVVVFYLLASGVAGWLFWGVLKDVRVHLSADLHGITVDIIRTQEMTSRYMAELADYLDSPDGPPSKRLLGRIDMLQTRVGVLTAPVQRMSLDPEFKAFYFSVVQDYVRALDALETLLAAGPPDAARVYEIEEQMFAVEDAISLLYTRSQTFIQGRATLQREALTWVSQILVAVVVALLVSLGGLALMLRKVHEQRALLQAQAITDPLTGLYNRRHLTAVGGPLLAQTLRSGKTLSLIALDVDHFKAFNDTYGHGAGDAALVSVGAALMQSTPRESDLVFRIGGEEFCCLVITDRPEDGKAIAERVRTAIEGLGIEHEKHPLGYITVSLGGVCAKPGDTLDELLSRADTALYRAKEEGRNRRVWG